MTFVIRTSKSRPEWSLHIAAVWTNLINSRPSTWCRSISFYDICLSGWHSAQLLWLLRVPPWMHGCLKDTVRRGDQMQKHSEIRMKFSLQRFVPVRAFRISFATHESIVLRNFQARPRSRKRTRERINYQLTTFWKFGNEVLHPPNSLLFEIRQQICSPHSFQAQWRIRSRSYWAEASRSSHLSTTYALRLPYLLFVVRKRQHVTIRWPFYPIVHKILKTVRVMSLASDYAVLPTSRV